MAAPLKRTVGSAQTEDYGERIAKAVRLLTAAHELRFQDVAAGIGLTTTQFSRRLNNHADWTPDELGRLARFFEIDAGPGFFFLPTDELRMRLMTSSAYKARTRSLLGAIGTDEGDQMELSFLAMPSLAVVG